MNQGVAECEGGGKSGKDYRRGEGKAGLERLTMSKQPFFRGALIACALGLALWALLLRQC